MSPFSNAIVQWTSSLDNILRNATFPVSLMYCQLQFYLNPGGYIEFGCSVSGSSFDIGFAWGAIVPSWVSQVAWFGTFTVISPVFMGAIAFDYQSCYFYTSDAVPYYYPAVVPPPNSTQCIPLPTIAYFNLSMTLFASFTVYPSLSGACAPDIWMSLPGLGVILRITTTDGTLFGPQVVLMYDLTFPGQSPYTLYIGAFLNLLQPTVIWVAVDDSGIGYFGVANEQVSWLYEYATNFGSLFEIGNYPESVNQTAQSTISTSNLTDWQVTLLGTQSVAAMCNYNPPPKETLASFQSETVFFDLSILSISLALCGNFTGLLWYGAQAEVQVWITFLGYSPVTQIAVTINYFNVGLMCGQQTPTDTLSFSQYYRLASPIGNSSFISYDADNFNLLIGTNGGDVNNPIFEVAAVIPLEDTPCGEYYGYYDMVWYAYGPGMLSAYAPAPPTPTSTPTPLPSSIGTTGGTPHTRFFSHAYVWIPCLAGGIALVAAIIAISVYMSKRKAADVERQPINRS